jgi:RNA polymerase sigma factor (sigma-70 family)
MSIYSREIGVQVVHENKAAAEAAASLAKYLEVSEYSARRAPLPHQNVILSDILYGLYDGMQRGYVESPTATGKTYLMARLAEAFYNSGMRVLILCDRTPQADQILGKSGDTGLLQVTDSMDFKDVGVHYDHSHASKDDPVVISTYASLNRFAETAELGKFDVFLADEAHKGLGPVTSANLKEFCPGAVKMAFTATATYSPDKKVSQIFDAPFHVTTLKEGIENDLVAPVNCLIYATSESIPFLDYSEDYTQRELEKLINLKPRNDKALEFAKDFIADGRQGIIACVPGANLAHARLLANELDGDFIKLPDGRYKFIRANSVGGHNSPGENRKILKDFENGQIDVLTFVDLISEGWNSRVASFLIDLQPTTSRVKKTQKIGRVIRKKPNNLHSIVVDFMDISMKYQITSLDVLQEKQYVIGRTHGSRNGGTGGNGGFNRKYIERIINSNLWRELEQINMYKVADLRLRTTSGEMNRLDPVVEKYEQLLGKSYEREPTNSMSLPINVIKDIGAFMRKYTRIERLTPDEEVLERFIQEHLPAQAERAPLLARLALQGFDAEPAGILQTDPRVPDEYDLIDEVLFNARNEAIEKSLSALPERERRIIRLRYGLEDGTSHTLDYIGAQLDITRERVRQLEGQALARLGSLRELMGTDT